MAKGWIKERFFERVLDVSVVEDTGVASFNGQVKDQEGNDLAVEESFLFTVQDALGPSATPITDATLISINEGTGDDSFNLGCVVTTNSNGYFEVEISNGEAGDIDCIVSISPFNPTINRWGTVLTVTQA